MRAGEKAAERASRRSSVWLLAGLGVILLAAGGRCLAASEGGSQVELLLVADDEHEGETDDEDQRLQGGRWEAQPLEAQPWGGPRIDETDSADAPGGEAGEEADPEETGDAGETGDAEIVEQPAVQPRAKELPSTICKPPAAECDDGELPPCCSGTCLNNQCAP